MIFQSLRRGAIQWLSVAFLSSAAYGELIFEKKEIEAVVRDNDTSAVIEFKFKNAGSKPAKVVRIESSCSCLKAETSNPSVLPGEDGKIDARFVVGDRTGEQVSNLTVTTDIPDQPVIRLTLKVKIPIFLEISPVALFWPVGGNLDPKKISVRKPQSAHVLVGLEVVSTSENFTTKLITVRPGLDYEIEVTPKSTAKFDRGDLRVNATFSGVGAKRFNCYAYVK